MQVYRSALFSKKNRWFIKVHGICRTLGNAFQELLFIKVCIEIDIVYYLKSSFSVHDIVVWKIID